MSKSKVREGYCICSESERVCTGSYWICHCTASLYTTRALNAIGKGSARKLHLLSYNEVVNFGGPVSLEKFLEVWHRVPSAFSKAVREQIVKERVAQKSAPNSRRRFLQSLSKDWQRDQEVLRRELAKEKERKLREEAQIKEDEERQARELEEEEERIRKLEKEAEEQKKRAMADPSAVTDEDLRAMEASLDGLGIDTLMVHLATLKDLYRYQGFDPANIRDVFLRWFKTVPVDHVVHVTETQTINVGGINNLKNCLTMLAFLYNYRGNNTKAILEGLSETPAGRLKTLLSKLHIMDHVIEKVGGKDVKNKDTLTLSRVAAAFPLYAMRVAINAGYDRKMIDMSDIGISQDSGVYKALCHPLAGSMLTKTQKKNKYQVFTFIAAVKFNAIIGKKGSKEDIGQIWVYHQAVLNSTAAKEEHKEAFWRDLEAPKMPPLEVMENKLKELGVSPQVMDEVVKFQ